MTPSLFFSSCRGVGQWVVLVGSLPIGAKNLDDYFHIGITKTTLIVCAPIWEFWVFNAERFETVVSFLIKQGGGETGVSAVSFLSPPTSFFCCCSSSQSSN